MRKATDTLDLTNQEHTLRMLRSTNPDTSGKAMAAIIDGATEGIRRFVIGGGGSEEDVQDLIHETAIVFWTHFNKKVKEPPRGSLITFFRLVAINKWVDYLRQTYSRSLNVSIEDLSDSEKEDLADTNDSFNEIDQAFSSKGAFHLSDTITIAQLIEAFKALSDKDQRNEFIERALANESLNKDIKTLIDRIVTLSYQAGQESSVTKATEAARSQLITNSDKQAQQLAPIIHEIKQNGAATLQDIADALNSAHITTKNGHIWYASTVKQVIERISALNGTSEISLPTDDFTKKLVPIISELKKGGLESPTAIARALNDQNITTKSGQKWYSNTVQVLLRRIDEIQQKGSNMTSRR